MRELADFVHCRAQDLVLLPNATTGKWAGKQIPRAPVLHDGCWICTACSV
jgi:hypothetical protein